MSELKQGAKVSVTRHGEGSNTKYQVQSENGVPVSPDELEPDEEVPF